MFWALSETEAVIVSWRKVYVVFHATITIFIPSAIHLLSSSGVIFYVVVWFHNFVWVSITNSFNLMSHYRDK